MVLIDTHFFVCNKKLSDLTPIKKKLKEKTRCTDVGQFLESDDFLLQTNK